MLSIRDRITAAACTLIGAAAPAAEASDLASSVLVYAELERIQTYEAITRFLKPLAGGRMLSAQLTVDIMTGASPNGAAPATEVQTFTRASGRGDYIVLPGHTPLDDTFQDNRVAFNGDLSFPIDRMTEGVIGGHASVEYDYQSIGVNGSLSREFHQRNTSLTVGAAYARDTLDPEGGPPIPFAPMLPAGVPPLRQENNKRKNVFDGLVGMTRILNPSMLLQLNYSASYSSGYLTDPFKLLSVIDMAPGANQGNPLSYLYEHRPGSRFKQSVYALSKSDIGGAVLDLSYRYMWDDWGIQSHTAEFRLMTPLTRTIQLQPQLRLYHQSAASFYRHSLRDGESLPEFATGDYRLGEFNAITLAVRWAALQNNGHLLSIRLGYYLQMGDSSPPDAIGVQQRLDMFPTVGAVIAQMSYSLSW